MLATRLPLRWPRGTSVQAAASSLSTSTNCADISHGIGRTPRALQPSTSHLSPAYRGHVPAGNREQHRCTSLRTALRHMKPPAPPAKLYLGLTGQGKFHGYCTVFESVNTYQEKSRHLCLSNNTILNQTLNTTAKLHHLRSHCPCKGDKHGQGTLHLPLLRSLPVLPSIPAERQENE